MLPPLDPPFTDDDLEAYFSWEDENDALETGEPMGEEREPFLSPVVAWSVCDTGSAEFAMRMLSHTEAAIAQVKADSKRFKEQIERWEAEQLAKPERTVNFFTGQLVTYARRKREEDGDKTVKLPSGAVTSRLNPARPEVTEEEPFIEWARTTPMVKPKWSPVMKEIKARVTFETVMVPNWGVGVLTLVRWPSADGESVWVAVPESMITTDDTQRSVVASETAAEDLPNFHAEVWPICEGRRVPGVVEVPAEVTYSVKPNLP